MGLEKISTGIPGLDKLLDGGFLKSSVNLIEGGPGSGKTTFGIQFLKEGARLNERCVFFSLDISKQSLLTFFSHLKIPVNKIEIIDFKVSSEEFWEIITNREKRRSMSTLPRSSIQLNFGKEIDSDDLLLDSFLRKIIKYSETADRIVVDSLSSLDTIAVDPRTKRDIISLMFRSLSELDVTSIIIAEGMLEEGILGMGCFRSMTPDFGATEFLADCVIRLIYSRIGGKYNRALRILKARGICHSRALSKIKLTKEGLKVVTGPLYGNLIENLFSKFLQGKEYG